MFCPKCGRALVLKQVGSGRKELYCVQGEMGLSLAMQQTLEVLYGPNAVPQSPNPPFHPQVHRGLHWFCPGDGERLDVQLGCSKCGKHLRDLVYPLVELHPHKKDEEP